MPVNTFRLALEPGTHKELAVIYLTAAVADIRRYAEECGEGLGSPHADAMLVGSEDVADVHMEAVQLLMSMSRLNPDQQCFFSSCLSVPQM